MTDDHSTKLTTPSLQHPLLGPQRSPTIPALPLAPAFDLQRLKAFALSRRIPVNLLGWQEAALYIAASEHPQLMPANPRGRPKIKDGPLQTLLGFSKARGRNDEDAIFYWVEAYRSKNSRENGQKPSIKTGVKAYVLALPNRTQGDDSELLQATQNSVETRYHRAKKRLASHTKRKQKIPPNIR